MAHRLRSAPPSPSFAEHIEPLATVLARLLPVLVLGAVFSVLASLGRSHVLAVRAHTWTTLAGVLGSGTLTLSMYLALPAIRLAQVPSPDLHTWQSTLRSCASYAEHGGITNLWVTTDAVHVVSPNVHHVYPLSSLERVEARSPRSLVETFSPFPLAFNLVLHRQDGREVPLFVLAPVGLARSIRRAIRANTDARPSCLYRQGEATRSPLFSPEKSP